MSSPRFTNESFVTAWTESSSVAEVVAKLGVSRNTIERHAVRLRKIGVALKSMRQNPVRSPPNVDELNRLITTLEKT